MPNVYCGSDYYTIAPSNTVWSIHGPNPCDTTRIIQ